MSVEEEEEQVFEILCRDRTENRSVAALQAGAQFVTQELNMYVCVCVCVCLCVCVYIYIAALLLLCCCFYGLGGVACRCIQYIYIYMCVCIYVYISALLLLYCCFY